MLRKLLCISGLLTAVLALRSEDAKVAWAKGKAVEYFTDDNPGNYVSGVVQRLQSRGRYLAIANDAVYTI